MTYSVKIAEPHLGREITFTAPTSVEALCMARSWSPFTGQVQYPPPTALYRAPLADVNLCAATPTYQRDPPDQTSTSYKMPDLPFEVYRTDDERLT